MGKDVTVITGNLAIVRLCKAMYWDYIEFRPPIKQRLRFLLKNPLKAIGGKRLLQKYNEEMSEQLEKGSEFYFTVMCCDLIGLNFINAVLQTRDFQSYFWPETKPNPRAMLINENLFDVSSIFLKSKISNQLRIRLFITQMIWNGLLEVHLIWKRGQDGVYLFLRDGFWSESLYKCVSFEGIFEPKLYQSINLEEYRDLKFPVFILGYTLAQDTKCYGKEFQEIFFQIVKEYSIQLKQHPGPEENYCVQSEEFKWLPADIPIEFFTNHIKFIIVTTSTALDGLSHIPCISLLKLLPNTSEDFDREIIINQMREPLENINFPESKEELIKLLKFYCD